MKIIFEDKSIIVCVKEPGVLSQESDRGEPNMVSLLKEHTGGDIFPVHRLDRDVGGVMVFAKTKQAAGELSKQIADRSFKKRYIAVVHGVFEQESGVLEDLLFKDSRKNKVFVVDRERKGVKKASLEYEVVETNGVDSIVSVLLHTGRTHQIRVQFASRKHPIVGDSKYGAKDGIKGIKLWSNEIRFRDVRSGRELTFTAECEFGLE